MPSRWTYCASFEKAEEIDTRNFAVTDSFLWRNIHTVRGHAYGPAMKLALRDTVFLYYRVKRQTPTFVRAFRIVHRRDHENRDGFKEFFGTPAVRVTDAALAARLTAAGYHANPNDPFVGFCLKPLDLPAPPLSPSWFNGRAFIRRLVP